MPLISNASPEFIRNLNNETKAGITNCASIEEVAQKTTDLLYDNFKESVVLARIFVTIPFQNLPKPNQKYVQNLVGNKIAINNKTLVLSLLGTRGKEADWNNRQTSNGHLGIPLISADFVQQIPMILRLLQDIGIPLDWLTTYQQTTPRFMNIAGQFYVEDARTAVDEQSRKIISAQDFVVKYGVKTVFACGGVHLASKTVFTLILFTNELIPKSQTELFLPFGVTLATYTGRLILNNQFFTTTT